jgi:hypothetical protein
MVPLVVRESVDHRFKAAGKKKSPASVSALPGEIFQCNPEKGSPFGVSDTLQKNARPT